MNIVEINTPSDAESAQDGESATFSPGWFKKTEIETFILDVLEFIEKDNWKLSLLLCDNTRIRCLNKQFRNKDEPTDVLSFTLGETDGAYFLPGDIVISLEMALENAEYFNIPANEELRRLLVHGILHLNGMDHSGYLAEKLKETGNPSAENGESEPMLQLQEKILSVLCETVPKHEP